MAEEKVELENEGTDKGYKMGLYTFAITCFLTVCGGLGNPNQMFYQMGYASLTYITIAAILFFIPYSFAVAEIGDAFTEEKESGIFTWLSHILGERYALITVFIYFSSYLLVGLSISGICISFSVMIFGKDVSQSWTMFGLSNQMTTTLIGSVWTLFWTVVSTRGMKSIAFLTRISAILFYYSIVSLAVVAIYAFVANGMHMAQPWHYEGIKSLFVGPNTQYNNTFSILGFLIFAIFAFGGMEGPSTFIDQVKDPSRVVPKGIFITVIATMVIYYFGVLGNGAFLNWNKVFTDPHVNLYNFSIYLGLQFSFVMGKMFGMSNAQADIFAKWYMVAIMWVGALAWLQIPLNKYFPIKNFISGLPEGMLPSYITKKNKHGFPANALYLQTIFTIVFAIAVVGLCHNDANQIYDYSTFMYTLATVVPWILITIAYIKFKSDDSIPKKYQFFSKRTGIIYNIISLLAISFAVIFSIIQPFSAGEYEEGILMISGPIVFGLLGYYVAYRYECKKKLLSK